MFFNCDFHRIKMMRKVNLLGDYLKDTVRNYKPDEINIINRTVQRADSLQNYFREKLHFENFNIMESLSTANTFLI